MNDPGHSPGSDRFGIAEGYFGVDGIWHDTPAETRRLLQEVIGEPRPGPPLWFVEHGTHPRLWSHCHLTLDSGRDLGVVDRIPEDTPLGYHDLRPVDGGPTTRLIVHPPTCPAPPVGWGLAVQLYSLCSAGTQGIGDLADLATLARWLQAAGGSVVLLSPLHAPSPGGHQQDSPYYPSTRRWRNPLHLRVEGLEPWRHALIERDDVWARKRDALWSRFRSRSAEQDASFRSWSAAQGESLGQWVRWAAGAERRQQRETREFHGWLQWLFDEQLAAVRAEAPEDRLIGDLAIGFDPDGADAELFAGVIARGWRIGAPPDAFNANGQDWGLPPLIPWRLRAACYEPFIQTLRGALRGLGGLRIDHVMGLFRQYWIPPGRGAADGAYVRFPAEELLAIVALEATRAGAFVVGEDLGTVEDTVRPALARFGILRTTVAWFEGEPPEEYPRQSLATLTTHDLPTATGLWRGMDGDAQLRRTLSELIGAPPATSAGEVVVRAYQALGAAPSALKLATLEDLCLSELRPNVPGTTLERPNWRLPLPLTVEELTRSPIPARVALALGESSARRGSAR